MSKITDAVAEDMVAWQHRPLDRAEPVLLIDAIVVKARDGQVANRPVSVCGHRVNCEGERVYSAHGLDPVRVGYGQLFGVRL